jgi:hypothetical protein
MFGRNQTISVGSFGFMHPQFDKLVGFLEFGGVGEEEALEDARKMSQVKLVVEVEGCFSEGGHDVLMESEGGPDDEGRQFLDCGFEASEVSLEEGGIDEEE